MDTDFLFVLIIIVVIIVIITAKHYQLIIMIISLCINVLFMMDINTDKIKQMASRIANKTMAFLENSPKQKNEMLSESVVPSVETTPDTDIYGPFYEKWHSYNTAYTDCYDEQKITDIVDNQKYNIDNAGVNLARARTRDQKCSDGWATKDANYYKYHFSGELDDAEAKVWWGRNDW